MSLIVHRRQFVIAREPVLIGPDWRSIPLSDGLQLSHHRDLSIKAVERDGRTLTLIGEAFAAEDSDRNGDLFQTFSGRFAWIDGCVLYPDASALLPVWYGDTSIGPVVTSSIALAASLGRSFPAVSPSARMRWGGLNWVPVPGGPVPGFSKLLRDQGLHLPSASPEFNARTFQLSPSFDAAKWSLAKNLTAVARSMGDRFETVHLALTAGLDSRTLLAAFVAAGVRFECVTQVFPGVARADIDVSARLCRRLGVPHRVVKPAPRCEGRLRAWREHSLETYRGAHDRYLFPHDSYRFLRHGGLQVGGGCFELGRRFYERRLGDLTFDTATGSDLWTRVEKTTPDPRAAADLDRWLAWRRSHPDGLDLADAFYLDQRLGGWLSAVEHALDMLPGVTAPAANCGAVFSALLTPDAADRSAGRLQRETISLLEPSLMRAPINPVPFRSRARKLVRRTAFRLKGGIRSFVSTGGSGSGHRTESPAGSLVRQLPSSSNP